MFDEEDVDEVIVDSRIVSGSLSLHVFITSIGAEPFFLGLLSQWLALIYKKKRNKTYLL